MLNFNSSVGIIFKPTAVVSINGETNHEFTDVLKHDTIADKLPTFDQYTDNVLTLTIEFPEIQLLVLLIAMLLNYLRSLLVLLF